MYVVCFLSEEERDRFTSSGMREAPFAFDCPLQHCAREESLDEDASTWYTP